MKILNNRYNNLNFVSDNIIILNNLKLLCNLLINYLLMSRINYSIALASNQIGLIKRKFIIRSSYYKYLVFINPYILLFGNNYFLNNESCLSVLFLSIKVFRYKYLKFSCVTFNGTIKCFYIKNFFSICFQHEYAHLMGYLIIN